MGESPNLTYDFSRKIRRLVIFQVVGTLLLGAGVAVAIALALQAPKEQFQIVQDSKGRTVRLNKFTGAVDIFDEGRNVQHGTEPKEFVTVFQDGAKSTLKLVSEANKVFYTFNLESPSSWVRERVIKQRKLFDRIFVLSLVDENEVQVLELPLLSTDFSLYGTAIRASGSADCPPGVFQRITKVNILY